MTRRRSMLGKLVVAVLAPMVLLAIPAAADSSFVEEVTAPTNDPMRLAPGYSTEREVLVVNEALDSSELHLRAQDLADDDNGCVGPEARDGDTTCEAGGGELAEWLQVTVTRLGTRDEQLWTGTLPDLAEGVVLESAMPSKAEWRLRLTTALPYAAGNDTMTDRVAYDLRWTMSSERGPDDTEILGVEEEAAAGGGRDGGTAGGGPRVAGTEAFGLPDTGAPVSLVLLGLAGGLLVIGSALVRSGRRTTVAVMPNVRNRR